MNKAKNKNTKETILISIIILIFIILFIIIYMNPIEKNGEIQDDIIFFKFLNQEKNQDKEINKKTIEYELKISRGEEKSKGISLLKTVNQKTLVNEKVAPGTKGKFQIKLTSNENIKYAIEIVGKNRKPKNLEFYIESGQEGKLNKNEIKIIPVNWQWNYEINEEEDIQDTVDGREIKEYNFEIIVKGK